MFFGKRSQLPPRLLTRRPRTTAPLKKSIIWSVLLLVGLFLIGLLGISRLNLEYSQRTLAQLHQQQIETAFTYSLDRINSRLQQVELESLEMVRLGLRLKSDSEDSRHSELALRMHERPGMAGLGFWYDLGQNRVSGAQVYRTADGIQPGAAQTGLDLRQPLWESLLAGGVSRSSFTWTPIYNHPISGEPIVSLVRPLVEGSRIVGVVSIDWKVQELLFLINRSGIAPGARIWLSSDKTKRAAWPLDEQQAAELLDQVEQYLLFESAGASMQHDTFSVADRPMELYYAASRSGLRLTAVIPRDEINAILQPLQENNLRILLLGGGIMLLLSAPLLFRATRPLRELKASYTDELTGLPNRAQLLHELQQESGVTLILINLDRFREINGLFGDACGDYILKEVALRLEGHIGSMKWESARLYRLSGDEFAIQAPRRKPELIEADLESLLRCLRRTPVYWQNHQINLSATLSAAVPWYDTPRQHSLFIHAREALREAREQGLHYRVYDGSQPLEQQFEHNQIWAGKLREALDHERLVAWYQPILNNTTGRIDKFECLVRMLDQEGNPASPGHFLGVAGKLRLDRHITRIMIERCFARFQDSSLQFSINLSYGDLQDAELTGFILEKLDETGVGSRVIFEILESDSIDNYDQVKAFVDQAKARGCRIAIDDFGTGYSNFEHLLQLRVDLIKIDGSLIRNLDSDSNARRVTRGIVGLARSMKIETVAEFVHSPEIQKEVLRLGISFSQGALIGMPLPELKVQVPKELVQQAYCGRSTSLQQQRSLMTGKR